MLKKACVLVSILVVLVTSGCIIPEEKQADLEDEIIYTREILPMELAGNFSFNAAGELQVNPTDNLEAFTGNFDAAQTNATILTPGAGLALEIHEIYVSTDDKLTDIVLLFNETNTVIFKLYVDKDQLGISNTLHLRGATNEPILFTAGAKTFISLTFHEVTL